MMRLLRFAFPLGVRSVFSCGVLSAVVLLAVGCARTPASPPDPLSPGDREIEGVVTAVDLSPMAYDGDGVVTVQVRPGARVIVRIPARQGLCAASFEGVNELAVGDRVAVRGALVEDDEGGIRPCLGETHYVRRR